MATRIEQLLKELGSIAFPGIFDTLSAKIAERVGFPMGFVSGYSVAATSIGEPDMGLLTQTELIDRARRICMSVKIPVIVDADTGYGNPLNVHRTVNELIAAGAAVVRVHAVRPNVEAIKLFIAAGGLGLLPAMQPFQGERDLFRKASADIAALEARRDKTRALKQGMMQELLTGRTRLV